MKGGGSVVDRGLDERVRSVTPQAEHRRRHRSFYQRGPSTSVLTCVVGPGIDRDTHRGDDTRADDRRDPARSSPRGSAARVAHAPDSTDDRRARRCAATASRLCCAIASPTTSLHRVDESRANDRGSARPSSAPTSAGRVADRHRVAELPGTRAATAAGATRARRDRLTWPPATRSRRRRRAGAARAATAAGSALAVRHERLAAGQRARRARPRAARRARRTRRRAAAPARRRCVSSTDAVAGEAQREREAPLLALRRVGPRCRGRRA